MNVWEAINGIRVIRTFAERPRAAEHEARILNAARRTGSSKNEQTWDSSSSTTAIISGS